LLPRGVRGEKNSGVDFKLSRGTAAGPVIIMRVDEPHGPRDQAPFEVRVKGEQGEYSGRANSRNAWSHMSAEPLPSELQSVLSLSCVLLSLV